MTIHSVLRADSEDYDQSGWMLRLIWVFAGHKIQIAGFFMQRLDKSNFKSDNIMF